MPRKKKKRKEKSRNPILVSDPTKQEVERLKAEKNAATFDEVIQDLIKEADNDKEEREPFMKL